MPLLPRSARRALTALFDPVVRRLVAARVKPGAVTTAGAAALAAGGAAFAVGAVRWGATLVLVGVALDTMDGAVARGGGRVSRFGALYDGVVDRLGDAFVFGGLLLFAAARVPTGWRVGVMLAALAAFAAVALVAYSRTRALAIGLGGPPGVAERNDLLGLLGVGALVVGGEFGGGPLAVVLAAVALSGGATVWSRLSRARRDVGEGGEQRGERGRRRKTQARRASVRADDPRKPRDGMR